MRILNKTEFLKQPTGIVYCRSTDTDDFYENPQSPIKIKGTTFKHEDYFVESLLSNVRHPLDIPYHGGERWGLEIYYMTNEGHSYPLDIYHWDVKPLDNEKFLVYEKEDLELLIKTLQEAKPYIA